MAVVATERPADPMTPWSARVVAVERETSDTVTLVVDVDVDVDVAAATGTGRGHFEPGQFAMISAFGVGEVPISMSGDPAERQQRHTIRSVGVVTKALCRLEPGDPVGWRGPFGRGWGLDDLAGRDVVVVAGGIGLAPLRPAIRAIMARRARFGRVLVLVGARTPSDLVFARELASWRAAGITVEVTVDYAEPGWTGPVGVVTTLVPRAPFTPSRAAALVCGPEVMMRFAARALIARGVDPALVRVSLERNMKCAVGRCGHCQLGSVFVCRDGPVLPWPRVAPLLEVRER